MPNWKTHIQISKILNEKLKYNKEQFELFVLGSILPDINNGYLVKDVSKIIPHNVTHFSQIDFESHKWFKKKYGKDIHDPLIFGYYTHIFTDYFWNSNFHKKAEENNIQEEYVTKVRRKQSDFMLYNNNFIDNTIKIDNMDEDLEQIKRIEEVSINKDDLIKVMNFLDTQKKHEAEFFYHTMEELEELKQKTIKCINQCIEDQQ